MKKIILILVASMMFHQAFSQMNDSKTFSDITEAKAYAKKHEIPILMVFAGSDWCKPCIQFKKTILLSEPFQAYSDTHLAILYLDFPMRKANKLSPEQTAHNEKLAEKYNTSGAFPEILMLTADEQVLGKLSFKNQSPEDFVTSCKALNK